MGEPRVTVLMPTNGRADVIGFAIRSFLDQTVPDFELFVVGDGCTDETADVVTGIGDPRIRWFDLPKAPGAGYANRNIALREARGKVVAFAQDDDLVFPDHLEWLLRMFERAATMWCYSRPLWIDDDGIIAPIFMNVTAPPMRREFLEARNSIPSCCVALRRTAGAAAGFFDETLERVADWALYRAIAERHGAGALAHQRQPTALHFRSRSRADGAWGPAPRDYLAALARGPGFWPKALALGLDADAPPQAQVAAMLKADAAGLAARVRYGVGQLQDLLAWSASANPTEFYFR